MWNYLFLKLDVFWNLDKLLLQYLCLKNTRTYYAEIKSIL